MLKRSRPRAARELGAAVYLARKEAQMQEKSYPRLDVDVELGTVSVRRSPADLSRVRLTIRVPAEKVLFLVDDVEDARQAEVSVDLPSKALERMRYHVAYEEPEDFGEPVEGPDVRSHEDAVVDAELPPDYVAPPAIAGPIQRALEDLQDRVKEDVARAVLAPPSGERRYCNAWIAEVNRTCHRRPGHEGEHLSDSELETLPPLEKNPDSY